MVFSDVWRFRLNIIQQCFKSVPKWNLIFTPNLSVRLGCSLWTLVGTCWLWNKERSFIQETAVHVDCDTRSPCRVLWTYFHSEDTSGYINIVSDWGNNAFITEMTEETKWFEPKLWCFPKPNQVISVHRKGSVCVFVLRERWMLFLGMLKFSCLGMRLCQCFNCYKGWMLECLVCFWFLGFQALILTGFMYFTTEHITGNKVKYSMRTNQWNGSTLNGVLVLFHISSCLLG